MSTLTLRELINTLSNMADNDVDLDRIKVAFPILSPGDGSGYSAGVESATLGIDGVVRLGGFAEKFINPKPPNSKVWYHGINVIDVHPDKELRSLTVKALRNYLNIGAVEALQIVNNLPHTIEDINDELARFMASTLESVGCEVELIGME